LGRLPKVSGSRRPGPVAPDPQALLGQALVGLALVAWASWYDGVGHAPCLEEPDRFNRELAALPGASNRRVEPATLTVK
jgi:pimeloyl-ACP methyl ester carboxylesterase